MQKKLGVLLVENNVITKQQLLDTLKFQTSHDCLLGDALIATGSISDENVINVFFSKQLSQGKLSLRDLELDRTIVDLIPYDIAQKYNMIAINKINRTLTVAISDSKDIFMLDAVKFLTGYTIKPIHTSVQEIQEAISINYKATTADVSPTISDTQNNNFQILSGEKNSIPENVETEITETAVVKLINHLILEAIKKNSSDIHIETYQRILRVRYRIDGKLVEMPPLPYNLRFAVISQIKTISGLDTSEQELPQDGRMKIKMGQNTIDIRISTTPTIFGEKVVMHILDASSLMLDIKEFGFPSTGLAHLEKALSAPYGMILVTGPTGSGKTTTLYSALNMLNRSDVNIMTVEDPVEYNIDGINQININQNTGLTFASALRSFLRQDPDIIMVGQIGDSETAEIAAKATLSGHLVLSTMHTNDAASSLTRLTEMGIDPFLSASAVKLIIAQRLVRKICPNCKEPIEHNDHKLFPFLNLSVKEQENLSIFAGKGCQMCNNTGFKGRCGLYEILPVTPDIQEMIISKTSPMAIREKAIAEGMASLRSLAMEKLKSGITTIEEVLRVAN